MATNSYAEKNTQLWLLELWFGGVPTVRMDCLHTEEDDVSCLSRHQNSKLLWGFWRAQVICISEKKGNEMRGFFVPRFSGALSLSKAACCSCAIRLCKEMPPGALTSWLPVFDCWAGCFLSFFLSSFAPQCHSHLSQQKSSSPLFHLGKSDINHDNLLLLKTPDHLAS